MSTDLDKRLRTLLWQSRLQLLKDNFLFVALFAIILFFIVTLSPFIASEEVGTVIERYPTTNSRGAEITLVVELDSGGHRNIEIRKEDNRENAKRVALRVQKSLLFGKSIVSFERFNE
jgi:hypothetical protein